MKEEHLSNLSMISGSLFVSARIRLKIKERQILSKMHFKPIGSSAVVELHKLTLHCDDDDDD